MTGENDGEQGAEHESFTRVAPWYDMVMTGVPYDFWVRYIEELIDRYGGETETVLDLACGTGRVSRLMARRGYRVVGVDASGEMIEEARRNTPVGEVEYVVQRAESLLLDRRFDLIVSLFDSLNYLIDPRDLAKAFRRMALHLEANGLLIFDMNGVYAFEAAMFDQRSFGHNRPVDYRWVSRYDPDRRICEVDMEFKVRKDGRVEEFREVHVQRAYLVSEVDGMLESAGFEILATLDAYTNRPARAKSDRIFWVARLAAGEPGTIDR